MMMKSKSFLACYDQGVTRAACEQDDQWMVTRSAVEHKVTCLTADPVNPRTIYAGTTNGVLRSDDNGLSWRRSGMDGHIIKSLAVSPHDGNIIYAGLKPALMFVSHDAGQSWRELHGFRRIRNRWWWFSPAEPPDLRPYVMCIAPSPTEPDVILAGVEFGAVVRSKDGGQSWSRHLRGARRDCHSLKFHARDGRWAYEAGGGGASFSQDGGHSFRKVKDGLAKNYGIVCAADGENPEIWYACVGSGPFNAFGEEPKVYLYRTTGNARWQPIGWQPHPLTSTPTALVTVPGAAGHLYAGLKTGDVWQTVDYGNTWHKLPFNLGGIWHSLLVL